LFGHKTILSHFVSFVLFYCRVKGRLAFLISEYIIISMIIFMLINCQISHVLTKVLRKKKMKILSSILDKMPKNALQFSLLGVTIDT